MVTAIFGLLGVIVGSILTLAREWYFHRQKNKKELEYLVVIVSCTLDAYVQQCADVVADDGLYQGQPDQEGFHRIQTDTPKFEPLELSVEWKALPAELMYSILRLPNRANSAQSMVDSAFDHCATPPDFSEGFEERSFQYAQLGLTAAALAERLRKVARITAPRVAGWDPVYYMKDELEKITNLRSERERTHALHLTRLNASNMT